MERDGLPGPPGMDLLWEKVMKAPESLRPFLAWGELLVTFLVQGIFLSMWILGLCILDGLMKEVLR